MLQRLKSKDHERWYKGVPLHPAWRDFRQFDADVPNPPSDDLTLDRIKNELGYVPGNVRWATMKEQSNNRRNSRAARRDAAADFPQLEGPKP